MTHNGNVALAFRSKPAIEFNADTEVLNIDQEYTYPTGKCEAKWYFNNNVLNNDDKIKIKTKGNITQLRIKQPGTNDSGLYAVELADKTANKKIKKKFRVNLRKDRSKAAPLYILTPKELWLDGNLALSFNIRSAHKLSVDWIKRHEDQVEKIETSGKYEKILKALGGDEHLVQLIISDLDEGDCANFEALVTNNHGQLKTVFSIDGKMPKNVPVFLKPPRIYEKLVKGVHSTVCEVVFKGKDDSPRLFWFNPKRQRIESNPRQVINLIPGEEYGSFVATLELSNYEPEDSGTYSCRCQNKTGKESAVADFVMNFEVPEKNGKT